MRACLVGYMRSNGTKVTRRRPVPHTTPGAALGRCQLARARYSAAVDAGGRGVRRAHAAPPEPSAAARCAL